jgi:hypothetical protein
MRFLLIGILFTISGVFNANAASISTFDNGGAGFDLTANSEIIFDTTNVDTLGVTEDSFAHLYQINVSESLQTLSSTITFASTAITDAVLSILDMDMTTVLASTSVSAGVEASLSWLMTNPPGEYWVQFSGTLVDAIDSYQLKVSAVPLPAAVWLFGSAMIGMIGFGRRKSIKGNAVAA